MVQCFFPVMDGHGPFAGSLVDCHVHQFQRGFFVGIDLAVAGELANLAIDRLDRIGGVDCLANARWKIKQRDDVYPFGSRYFCAALPRFNTTPANSPVSSWLSIRSLPLAIT